MDNPNSFSTTPFRSIDTTSAFHHIMMDVPSGSRLNGSEVAMAVEDEKEDDEDDGEVEVLARDLATSFSTPMVSAASAPVSVLSPPTVSSSTKFSTSNGVIQINQRSTPAVGGNLKRLCHPVTAKDVNQFQEIWKVLCLQDPTISKFDWMDTTFLDWLEQSFFVLDHADWKDFRQWTDEKFFRAVLDLMGTQSFGAVKDVPHFEKQLLDLRIVVNMSTGMTATFNSYTNPIIQIIKDMAAGFLSFSMPVWVRLLKGLLGKLGTVPPFNIWKGNIEIAAPKCLSEYKTCIVTECHITFEVYRNALRYGYISQTESVSMIVADSSSSTVGRDNKKRKMVEKQGDKHGGKLPLQVCDGCGFKGYHNKANCHKAGGVNGSVAHPDFNRSDKPWAESVNGKKWKAAGFENIVVTMPSRTPGNYVPKAPRGPKKGCKESTHTSVSPDVLCLLTSESAPSHHPLFPSSVSSLFHIEERLPLKTLIDSGATVGNYVSTDVATWLMSHGVKKCACAAVSVCSPLGVCQRLDARLRFSVTINHEITSTPYDFELDAKVVDLAHTQAGLIIGLPTIRAFNLFTIFSYKFSSDEVAGLIIW